MPEHPVFKRSLLFVSLVAVAVGGCGPEDTAGSKDKAAIEALGVVPQGITCGGHDCLFVRTPKTWEQAAHSTGECKPLGSPG
ncbi:MULTISPECIES: hypothetical protein [Corallococcus]|uniref:hypothetical protein n=1 Tax=Corallococcus TaxID=83461 RepID=UPI0011E5AA52|nr:MULTISPECIES: hypothetical protein [Corallococcus]NRD54967.1 hypothetical protein [Corallococcus exiguus]